ncbi:MAG: monofunctional biosynthetic peptidoglycan transglycosylase, partial [Thermoanaerobaculia bacterium]
MKRILLGLPLGLAAGIALFFLTLPDVTPLRHEMPRTTAFMELRKRELERRGLRPVLDWRPVPMARIAPSLQRAVVVAEDARFWNHEGVDWQAVRRALEEDLAEGGGRRGASTITQQLAKNLYLSSSRSPWRKLREWAIARRLERELTKHRILELYLNVIEFGQSTYGVEAAARRYFGKPASRVTAREAATLAAVIPSPRIYDPVRHPRRVARRAGRILRWMGKWRTYAVSPSGTPSPPSEPT